MKRWHAALTLVFVVIAAPTPVLAEVSRPKPVAVDKRADIERLLEMTGALAVGKQMADAIVGQLSQTLRRARPDIPERVLNALPEDVGAVLDANMPGLKAALIPLYDRHFSHQEIRDMIQFYNTDTGRKTIRVMPLLLHESMQLGQHWGESLGPELEQRIAARLKREGKAGKL